MMMMSAILLVYTAIVVPVQICIWSYDDPCNMFPTLPFDVAVDVFFLVAFPSAWLNALLSVADVATQYAG